jgi:hypothetical protein
VNVDWAELDSRVSDLGLTGFGTSVAEASLKILLGEIILPDRATIERALGVHAIVAATDRCFGLCPAVDTARSVLDYLRPSAAMRRCYEIYRSSVDADIRGAAVWLLRTVGDIRVLPWITEFLGDEDGGVQVQAAYVLEFVIWSVKDSEDWHPTPELEAAVALAERRANPQVREWAAQARALLNYKTGERISRDERQQPAELLDELNRLANAYSSVFGREAEANGSAGRLALADEYETIAAKFEQLAAYPSAQLAYDHALFIFNEELGAGSARAMAAKESTRRLSVKTGL